MVIISEYTQLCAMWKRLATFNIIFSTLRKIRILGLQLIGNINKSAVYFLNYLMNCVVCKMSENIHDNFQELNLKYIKFNIYTTKENNNFSHFCSIVF